MDGFFGIEIARRALQTSQLGMDVTAHNIANANTPGYTRQRLIQGTTTPYPAPEYRRPLIQGQLGTGVEMKSIQRVRDGYFDGQIRREAQTLSQWETKERILKQIEVIFNEPSEAGLANIVGDFWSAWHQLSSNPESRATRSTLLEAARMLTTSFNQLAGKLDRLRDNINEQVSAKVDEINSIAQKILAANKDIKHVRMYGIEPNDFMDQRDLLLEKLTKIADAQVHELESGAVEIFINGAQLVGEYTISQLTVVENPLNNNHYDVKWATDGSNMTSFRGELKSLLDLRDVDVPLYRADLDALVGTMIVEVNNIHRAGIGLDGTTTGLDFFAGTNALNIAISPEVNDPNNIAASSSGAPGDNSNALAIAQLKSALLMSGGTITMDDFYRSSIVDLGVKSQEATRMASNAKLYYEHIDKFRQSVMGVSLDEEATNMVKYQKAYQAAARVISVMDNLLDVLINQMAR